MVTLLGKPYTVCIQKHQKTLDLYQAEPFCWTSIFFPRENIEHVCRLCDGHIRIVRNPILLYIYVYPVMFMIFQVNLILLTVILLYHTTHCTVEYYFRNTTILDFLIAGTVRVYIGDLCTRTNVVSVT